jgi:outer membrane protein OmpA-like peptidoglycan-associated protein
MTMNRLGFALAAAALATLGVTGCATKKYVKLQTVPLVEHQTQQDKQIAENGQQIKDVDGRAQVGIDNAQGAADKALKTGQNASQQAQAAQATADGAVHRVDSLEGIVKGLDSYKVAAEVSVNFASGQSALSKEAEAQLDELAAKVGQSGFILEVTGATDSRGSAELNYQLSQRRATSVVTYLVAKHNIPAHRFYLVGLGKDKQVADNKTADGRKQNRRVTVQLLSNAGLEAIAANGR